MSLLTTSELGLAGYSNRARVSYPNEQLPVALSRFGLPSTPLLPIFDVPAPLDVLLSTPTLVLIRFSSPECFPLVYVSPVVQLSVCQIAGNLFTFSIAIAPTIHDGTRLARLFSTLSFPMLSNSSEIVNFTFRLCNLGLRQLVFVSLSFDFEEPNRRPHTSQISTTVLGLTLRRVNLKELGSVSQPRLAYAMMMFAEGVWC